MTTVPLRQLRQAAGLTQAELARRATIGQYVISDLETGRTRTPSLDTARKLARALNVKIEDLIAEEPAHATN